MRLLFILRFKFQICKFSSENVFFGVAHRHLFILGTESKKVFGTSQAISYLGSFLALAGGISVLSLLQLLLDLLRLIIPLRDTDTEIRKIREIPTIATKTKFHILSEKLTHLRKHAADYARISNVHGFSNMTGGFRKKIFWLMVLTVATASCIYFTRNLSQNEVIIELDDGVWSVDKVGFFDEFNDFPKKKGFSSRYRSPR